MTVRERNHRETKLSKNKAKASVVPVVLVGGKEAAATLPLAETVAAAAAVAVAFNAASMPKTFSTAFWVIGEKKSAGTSVAAGTA